MVPTVRSTRYEERENFVLCVYVSVGFVCGLML